MKKMRLHCAGMINYLITIVGAFFFGYFSARYAFSSFEEVRTIYCISKKDLTFFIRFCSKFLQEWYLE